MKHGGRRMFWKEKQGDREKLSTAEMVVVSRRRLVSGGTGSDISWPSK